MSESSDDQQSRVLKFIAWATTRPTLADRFLRSSVRKRRAVAASAVIATAGAGIASGPSAVAHTKAQLKKSATSLSDELGVNVEIRNQTGLPDDVAAVLVLGWVAGGVTALRKISQKSAQIRAESVKGLDDVKVWVEQVDMGDKPVQVLKVKNLSQAPIDGVTVRLRVVTKQSGYPYLPNAGNVSVEITCPIPPGEYLTPLDMDEIRKSANVGNSTRNMSTKETRAVVRRSISTNNEPVATRRGRRAVTAGGVAWSDSDGRQLDRVYGAPGNQGGRDLVDGVDPGSRWARFAGPGHTITINRLGRVAKDPGVGQTIDEVTPVVDLGRTL